MFYLLRSIKVAGHEIECSHGELETDEESRCWSVTMCGVKPTSLMVLHRLPQNQTHEAVFVTDEGRTILGSVVQPKGTIDVLSDITMTGAGPLRFVD